MVDYIQHHKCNQSVAGREIGREGQEVSQLRRARPIAPRCHRTRGIHSMAATRGITSREPLITNQIGHQCVCERDGILGNAFLPSFAVFGVWVASCCYNTLRHVMFHKLGIVTNPLFSTATFQLSSVPILSNGQVAVVWNRRQNIHIWEMSCIQLTVAGERLQIRKLH